MTKPNFESVNIEAVLKAEQPQASDNTFLTNESIEVKSVYTEQDVQGLDHLQDVAVLHQIRGPYPTMYVARPDVRQHAVLNSRRIKCLYKPLSNGQKVFLYSI